MDRLRLLRDIAGEIDACPTGWMVLIHRRTGEQWSVSEEEISEVSEAIEGSVDQDDEDHRSGWEREAFEKAHEVLTSEDWLEFPKDDFDDYGAMRDFCEALEGEKQDRLLSAIRGRGAFRRFKELIRRFGVEDQWYDFHDRRLEAFVAEWLDEQGIPYGK